MWHISQVLKRNILTLSALICYTIDVVNEGNKIPKGDILETFLEIVGGTVNLLTLTGMAVKAFKFIKNKKK